jgi:hypothetical protein
MYCNGTALLGALRQLHNSEYSGNIYEGEYSSNGFSVTHNNHSSYIPCVRPRNIGIENVWDAEGNSKYVE